MNTLSSLEQNPEYQKTVYPREQLYLTISTIISFILWVVIILGTLGISLFYVGIVALSIAIGHALFLSYIHGYGIKITKKQFPKIYKLAEEVAEKLQMEKVPAIYIYNMDGVFNAFATHFFSRNFVIITTTILDACSDDLEKIKFILAHEMVHLQRGHTRKQFFLFPSRIVPWLGNAYSRACEYTCDGIAGKFILDNKKDAIEGVLLLPTADKNRAAEVDLDGYDEQRLTSGSFWMTLVEIKATHPFSFNRVAYLRSLFGDDMKKVRRNFFGILLAPIFSLQTIIWLYIFGILLASVFPVFKGYMDRAKEREEQKIQSHTGFLEEYQSTNSEEN